MRAALWIVVVASLVGAGVSWQKQRELKLANETLRRQILQEEAQQQVASPSTSKDQELREASSEILKLRNEVTELREKSRAADGVVQENARLKSELAQLKGNPQAAPVPDEAKDYFGREAWAFAGYNSPEAALVSAIWAMKEGDPVTYLQSLSPDEQERMTKVWESKSEAEIAAKHQGDVSTITGFKILEKQTTPAGEMEMKVHIEGVNRTETVRMKLQGNEWKFGGFIRPQ